MARHGAERVRRQLVWQHSVPSLLAAYDAVFASSPVGTRTMTAIHDTPVYK
jgi:hypothetical protein